MVTSFYDKLIVGNRFDSKTERKIEEHFTSDKTRIIFSSPFRRLQQKTQVFSLESNAAVRSRLTHTLEVATIGISIAERIVARLVDKQMISSTLVIPFVRIVENACLLHDIGNPPFGHFAENAIKEWFNKALKDYFFITERGVKEEHFGGSSPIRKELIPDFENFDGNPQGLRIVATLQGFPGDERRIGLNLTFSQLASIIKYPTQTNGLSSRYKKAGYFYTESEKVKEIKATLGFGDRYPLTYIMEAADDISYCLSDIEDGIEKRILTSTEFFQKLREEMSTVGLGAVKEYDKYFSRGTKLDFYQFKIEFTRELIVEAIDTYVDRHKEILEGSLYELIDKDTKWGMMLKCLKNVARKYLFRSPDAENNELAGHEIIMGLLRKYGALLKLDHKKVYDFVIAKEDLNKAPSTRLDLEWRLFNRLPGKYVEAYKFQYEECQKRFSDSDEFKQYEWFYRAHLIVDYISGMTDNYALETYKLLYGIKL